MNTDTKEQKSTLSKLHTSIFLFPFLMMCFHNIYFALYIFAFSPKLIVDIKDLAKIIYYDSPIQNFYMYDDLLFFVLVYLWARPIFKFISMPDNERLRNIAKNKIENVSKSVLYLYTIVFAYVLSVHFYTFSSILQWERFVYCIAPALILTYLTQTVLSLIYVNTQLFGLDKLFALLYSRSELYKLKGDRTLSLWFKVIMLTIFNTLIPIGTITFLLYSKYAGAINENLIGVIVFSLYLSLTITIIGLAFLSKGFSKPILDLNKKMDQLAKGNFDVKSRIYSNDEIAELKFHFNSMVDDLKERENIRDMFGKYLSIEIAKKLLNGEIDLGGEEVQGAVLFSDIRNFTSMSENMSASEVVQFLNCYFSFVTEPILNRKGVINKFIGDAVMVIFSPVFGNENYCEQAILTAIEMKESLAKFNEKFPEYGGVEFGVGIHSGRLVAGNIGVKERLEYTVIGDTVNLASRLEGKTKDLSRNIIISEAVADNITDSVRSEVNLEDMGIINVKGKAEEIKVFSVK